MNEFETISLKNGLDGYSAQKKLSGLAKISGFNKVSIGEIEICIRELVANAFRHRTIEPRIKFCLMDDGDKKGVQIIYEDKGPGIANSGWALSNGHSTKGALGIGLGAIKRLMDEFDIYSLPEEKETFLSKRKKGTVIVGVKWFKDKQKFSPGKMRFGAVCQRKPGSEKSGDAYFLKFFDHKVICAVVDGLGSGELAYEASREAIAYLKENYAQNLENIFTRLHLKLVSTWGAVAGIVLVDFRQKKMNYGAVGNIQTRVINSPVPIHLSFFNGILGAKMRKVKVFEYPWTEGNMVIIHTDGISSTWSLEAYPHLKEKSPLLIAAVLARDFAQENDDVTIIVGR